MVRAASEFECMANWLWLQAGNLSIYYLPMSANWQLTPALLEAAANITLV